MAGDSSQIQRQIQRVDAESIGLLETGAADDPPKTSGHNCSCMTWKTGVACAIFASMAVFGLAFVIGMHPASVPAAENAGQQLADKIVFANGKDADHNAISQKEKQRVAEKHKIPPPMMQRSENGWEEHRVENTVAVEWEGWGVALAWWANLFGDDAALADLVWTLKEGINLGSSAELQNLPGLGLNIARYNAGGCVGAENDGSSGNPPGQAGDETMDYRNIVDYKRMQGFWLNWYDKDTGSDSWNWKADKKQIHMLKNAKERGANIFELFSNSPMWWMTSSKNPAGSRNENKQNLQSHNVQDLAYYLAQVVKHFDEKYHIHFHSVSPFNEPRGNKHGCWWYSGSGNTGQEGNCIFVKQQSKIIQALHAELEKAGLRNVRISASEENTFDMAKRTWLEMDAETRSMIGQVNVHGYQELFGDRVFLKEKTLGGKTLWMSEFSDDDRWPDGGLSNGMVLANCIHYDFEYLGMSSWSYWQILDATDN